MFRFFDQYPILLQVQHRVSPNGLALLVDAVDRGPIQKGSRHIAVGTLANASSFSPSDETVMVTRCKNS